MKGLMGLSLAAAGLKGDGGRTIDAARLADGGPKNRFDPGNGYKDEYLKIWKGE